MITKDIVMCKKVERINLKEGMIDMSMAHKFSKSTVKTTVEQIIIKELTHIPLVPMIRRSMVGMIVERIM